MRITMFDSLMAAAEQGARPVAFLNPRTGAVNPRAGFFVRVLRDRDVYLPQGEALSEAALWDAFRASADVLTADGEHWLCVQRFGGFWSIGVACRVTERAHAEAVALTEAGLYFDCAAGWYESLPSVSHS